MYQFIKKDEDTTILRFKDKEFEIKRDVELSSKLQGLYNKARTKMYIDLTKDGFSADDLVIKTKKNGKTYEDNTNLIKLEQKYIETEQLNFFQEMSNQCFGMPLDAIIVELGLNTEEAKVFGKEFGEALTGTNKSPSQG